MKELIIILQMIFILISAQAQKINSNYIGKHIDTVYFFQPFGFVSTIIQGERQTSTELTKSIGDTLSRLIAEQFPGEYIVIYDSMLMNDFKTQDNIIVTLDRVGKIKNQVFSIVPTGALFDSILNNYPGRYYGLIYFNGFMNNRVKSVVIQSVALMVISSILTAGIITMFLVPIPSEVRVTLLVMDKQEKKFVFYGNKRKTKTYFENINKHKLVNRLLKKYKNKLSEKE